MNNKKYNRVLKTSNVSMWKFGASCILFIVLFTGLEVSVRKSNMLLPICIPWMYDYEVLFAVSIVLALIIKYLCKSKKKFSISMANVFLEIGCFYSHDSCGHLLDKQFFRLGRKSETLRRINYRHTAGFCWTIKDC